MLLVAPPFMRSKTFASTGWLNPATGVSVALTSSSVNWGTPGNVLSENGTVAGTAGLLSGTQFSRWLVARNFGVSLPSGASVEGIEVRYKARGFSSPGFYDAKDHLVQLFQSTTPIGTDQSSASAWASGTGSTLIFETRGGSGNKWGYALDKAAVEDTDFGFGLAVKRSTTTQASAEIDVMQMNVHYSY